MNQSTFWIKLISKKFLYAFFMLFVISAISFLVVNSAPNNFFPGGDLNPNITEDDIEHLKTVYGLDKGVVERYLLWIEALMRMDFGVSFSSGKAVSDEILSRLPITVAISLISMAFVFAISLWFGIRSALKAGTLMDKIVRQVALVSYAFPSFYLALLMIMVFSLYFGLFPISGIRSAEAKSGIWDLLDLAWHLALPIAVVVLSGFGSLLIYVRSLTIEILKSDYIFYARARGIDRQTIIRRYILPNLYPPIITILGLSLPAVIGGSVILETIFSINGMGLLFYQSALSRDYPVIMGILIIGAMLTLLGNITADLVLSKLNPHFGEKSD